MTTGKLVSQVRLSTFKLACGPMTSCVRPTARLFVQLRTHSVQLRNMMLAGPNDYTLDAELNPVCHLLALLGA